MRPISYTYPHLYPMESGKLAENTCIQTSQSVNRIVVLINWRVSQSLQLVTCPEYSELCIRFKGGMYFRQSREFSFRGITRNTSLINPDELTSWWFQKVQASRQTEPLAHQTLHSILNNHW